MIAATNPGSATAEAVAFAAAVELLGPRLVATQDEVPARRIGASFQAAPGALDSEYCVLLRSRYVGESPSSRREPGVDGGELEARDAEDDDACESG